MSRARFLRTVTGVTPYYPIASPLQSMRSIVESVAHRHGVTAAEIVGPSKKRHIAMARQEAMARLVAAGRWSSTQIGRALRRDHTTVLYGARAHAERVAER